MHKLSLFLFFYLIFPEAAVLVLILGCAAYAKCTQMKKAVIRAQVQPVLYPAVQTAVIVPQAAVAVPQTAVIAVAVPAVPAAAVPAAAVPAAVAN